MIAKLVYIQYLNSKYLIAKLRKYKLSHLKFQIDMKLKLKLKIISQSYKQNVAETYKYPQTFRLSYLVWGRLWCVETVIMMETLENIRIFLFYTIFLVI